MARDRRTWGGEIKTSGVPWTLRLGASVVHDLGDVHDGTSGSATAQFWMQLSRRLIVGIGGALDWSDTRFMRTFFGVTPAEGVNSGLPAYDPGGGVKSRDLWLGLLWIRHPDWVAGAGVYWQKLAGGAADSPIVRERGDSNQISAGGGVAYIWK